VASRPTVLVVDDERDAADVYALRLQEEYDTEVAYSGEAALGAVRADTDVVLLDRRMPEMSGGEVLRTLRERSFEGSVIMLTAVDPGLEVVDMPFDEYITKPAEKEKLVAAINRQVELDRGEARAQYHEVRSKLSVLERELPPDQLNSKTLSRLRERANTLKQQLSDASVADADPDFRSESDIAAPTTSLTSRRPTGNSS
jgi:Response regulators consisting of a CheY-like receiver domain and a winged-helix DNA-binding domain